LRKYGVHYSHLAFAYREAEGHGRKVWHVLHKLNECGSDHAAIYRQGLGQSFLSDPFRYEAVSVAPVGQIQAAPLPVTTDRQRALAMQRWPYSMVSYVWRERYQQSNQWVLETMAAAMLPPGASRQQAQALAVGPSLCAGRAAPERAGAARRTGHGGRYRLRRPSACQALCRADRNGDGGFGISSA
jgi:hypothetical protein